MTGTRFSAQDHIRATGLGVSLASCERCESSKKIDDWNRSKIANLESELSQNIEFEEGLMAEASGIRLSRDVWKFWFFVAAAIASLALASNAGLLR